jgi:hypothetical protein
MPPTHAPAARLTTSPDDPPRPRVRRVPVGCLRVAVPFADLFRPHTPDELAALRQAIADDGVLSPVLTCTTPTWGRTLVDGLARVELAGALGVACPVADLGHLPDEDARRKATDLNAARRHLTAAELERARRDRILRVVESRAQRKSTRTIAREEGLSQSQVARDLEVAASMPEVLARYPRVRMVLRPGHVLSSKGNAMRVPKPPPLAPQWAAEKAAKLVRQLRAASLQVLAGRGGPALRKAARRLGVPVSDGCTEWPTLDALAAAFAEVAADPDPEPDDPDAD